MKTTADDPPVYLFFDSVPTLGQPHKDPPHSANYGAGLAEKLKTLGVPSELNYPGAPGMVRPRPATSESRPLRCDVAPPRSVT
ncbi:MAG: hypothetical protein ACOYOF_12975 [Verrucomicrobiaceae bacterium]